MGLGYFLTEKIIYDTTTGQLLTNGTWVCLSWLSLYVFAQQYV